MPSGRRPGVRATYQAVADYHTGRCRQLPAQQAGGPPWPAIAEHAAVIARLSVALEPFVADVITTTVRDYDPVVRLVRQPTDHPFGEGPTEDDHRVVGLATLDASRDAGNRWIFPELADEGLEPWPGVRYVCFAGALQPTCGVDVTGFVERGIASLRARRAYMRGLVPAPSTGAVPVLEQRPAVLGWGWLPPYVRSSPADPGQPTPVGWRRSSRLSTARRRADCLRDGEPGAAAAGSASGLVAGTLGGSRAVGRERPDSDWDFGRSSCPPTRPATAQRAGDKAGSAASCGRTRFTITSAVCPAARCSQAGRASPAHGGGLSGISW